MMTDEDRTCRAGTLAARLLRLARTGADSAGTTLSEVEDPALRGAVSAALLSALTGAVTAAWGRGWQPADLGRTASRELPVELHGELLHAVREELSTYARSTVDPAWWVQVAGLEEDVEAGRKRRGRDEPGDPLSLWHEECWRRARLTSVLERLVRLPVIGPLPGEAHHPGADAPEVDDKVLTRVRRMLAQAEGTPYEAEAEAFTAAAQSLMARYRIDRAMLEESDPDRPGRGPAAVRLSVDRPYEQPKAMLLSVVASANRCRALWNQGLGFVTVVGHQADRDAVEMLFTSLLVQGTSAMRREGDRRPQRARSRGFRSSFLSGFATRVGQRLEEASAAAETAADRARATVPPGPGALDPDPLALVLRRRDEAVEALLQRLFPVTRSTRARTVSDPAGFHQGQVAADRADLGVGGRLDGRAS